MYVHNMRAPRGTASSTTVVAASVAVLAAAGGARADWNDFVNWFETVFHLNSASSSGSASASSAAAMPQFVASTATAPAGMPVFVNDQAPAHAATTATAAIPVFVPQASSSVDVPVFMPAGASTTAASASADAVAESDSSFAAPITVAVAATTDAATTTTTTTTSTTTTTETTTTSTTTTTTTTSTTTTTTTTTTVAAPAVSPARVVIYTNEANDYLLDTAYNIINVNFWNPNSEPNFDPSPYHAAGKKVMISAFGGGINPTSDGLDAVSTANSLASYVIKNGFDGADIDWEDSSAFNANGDGEAWLITFTRQLRANLPSPYLISHAPQAPYFSPGMYHKGAYLAIDSSVGDLIDFYNVQFYNQGSSSYDSCETLFYTANGWASKSAVFEIADQGVPLNKIVIGKPVTSAGVDSGATGYMDAQEMADCFATAEQYGWNAGVMGWRFGLDIQGTWGATLAAGLVL
ncbi:hypothetical protein HDU84_008029 [Entophlyctis sp. JEL0112]|nr:hypothetical protein HDU84_008029 [Entophlyctis sp. JEL0112]